MHSTMPDADKPDLGLRMMSKEQIGGGDGIIGDFKRPCFNVDGHDPAGIVFFYLRPDLSFIESVPRLANSSEL